MATSLVIVESPTKARKIAEYLGDGFVVESSVGHVRDLPRGAEDVPAAFKGEPWARLGVDVDNDFKPLYVVTGRARDQVKRLRRLLDDADELLLATDEDREGEAIAWHLLEVLNPRVPVKRMVFHEITQKAIRDAVASPRELDRRLVDAQEARRILDRLYGYEVSPVLWKKVMPRLSAGRVQSVAVRLVVERERERMAFVRAGYWDVTGTFTGASGGEAFDATMVALDGSRVATGRDFDATGQATDGAVVLDEARAGALVEGLGDATLTVTARESRPYRRRPAAPFMTSTLQQEAGRKLGFSSGRTMRAAQRLYENGHITYMRTDSTTLSADALSAARDLIRERFGARRLPSEPRAYVRKVKNAQEAHEAIRPSGDRFAPPEQVAADVGADESRVYELIWQRTVASQMIDVTGETVTLRMEATTPAGERAEFATSGTVITEPGFRLAYVEEADGGADREQVLPPLVEGDRVDVASLAAGGHETSPPARFNEASLVRRLEELGVGRPSTYASIIETIQSRGYVWKRGNALVPAFTAFATIRLLEEHFPDLVDYAFTARMEDDLDLIAGGDQEPTPWLDRFYFGDARARAEGGTGHEALGLKELVSDLGDIDARQINSIPLGVDAEGVGVTARVGRYGPYVERGEDRASIPEDLPPDELTLDQAMELLAAPSDDRVLGVDPDSGLDVIVRAGRFGPFVQLGRPEELGDVKPATASLLSSMDPVTIGLEDAVRLLSLPRVVGVDPSDGEQIQALNGRYGPYLKKGTDSRSLETEEQLFTVDLTQALALFAEPKRRRGQAPARPPLAELGEDPVSGGAMVVKDGRFGPYVTDGVVNASLRKGDDPTSLAAERASELLEMRRQKLKDDGKWPPAAANKRGAKKASAKKAGAKKAGAKKAAAKKASAKKASAKKASAKKASAKKASAKKAGAEKAGADGAGTSTTSASTSGDGDG